MNAYSEFIPSTIEVVGTDEQNRITIWDREHRRLHRVNVGELTRSSLIQLCGLPAFFEIKDKLEKDQDPTSIIRDAIADVSRGNFFASADSLGQGIWKNPEGNGYLLVSGNSALVLDGGVKVVQGPKIGKKMLDYTDDPWISGDQLGAAVTYISSFNDPRIAVQRVFTELHDALSPWSFEHAWDRSLVVAMIFATAVQGSLDFRPHVWVTGNTNTGKSSLMTFLHRLWPYAIDCQGETSEAAVRQSIGHRALPLLMDEQEKRRGLNGVLKLLRSASRGGVVRKGNQAGTGLNYQMKVIAWMFAIIPDLREEADRNRFISINLKPLEQEMVIPSAVVASDLGHKLVAASLTILDEAMSLWRDISTDQSVRQFGRLSDLYALPMAFESAVFARSRDETLARLLVILTTQHQQQQAFYINDGDDFIETILDIKPDSGDTVAALLCGSSRHVDAELALVGIGKRRKQGEVHVFLNTQKLARHMPKDSRWADTDIGHMLRRLPGAKTGEKLRFGHQTLSGVWVPLKSLLPDAPSPAPAVVEPPPVEPPKLFSMTKLKLPKSNPELPRMLTQGEYESGTDQDLDSLLAEVDVPVDKD